jgi:hypothetical protein
MIFDTYFNSIKNILLKTIKKIDDNKIVFYIVFFIIYFFIYFSINISAISKQGDDNLIASVSNILTSKKWIIIFVNIVYVLSLVWIFIFYYKNIKNITPKIQMVTIFPAVLLSAIVIYLNVIQFYNKLVIFSTSKIIQNLFTIFSFIFYVLLFSLFIYNVLILDNIINIEFLLSIELLLLFLGNYVFLSIINITQIYNQLKNIDYSLISINCLQNPVKSTNTQLIDIANKYGDSYLKTINNIPIKYYNKKLNSYENLVLADFYYPGSYYTYLSTTPLNGIPNLEAIKIALKQFRVRIIHLDLYSDKDDPYDPEANPIVKCENMKEGSKPLQLEECFMIIKKFGWLSSDNTSYPLFLYLNFKFNQDNQNIYMKIYHLLLKYFSKNIIDKKYSFSGRNGTFPISQLPMSEAINKIIISTSNYPTKTVLDELINTSSNTLTENFNLYEYKESYIHFDNVGLSQDFSKIDLVNSSQHNINLFYSNPNSKYKNNSNEKAGLFNPSFQDCAQYGVQGTLMYIFLPDNNLNKWNLYFKNKNNLDPVLKDEVLRFVNNTKNELQKQNPILGLQKPQKYCVLPGLITTEKSNLSDKVTNSSCK